jgi:hypothetical protein
VLYDWRFTTNQFFLATSPLRPTTTIFILQLNACGYSAYVTSSLTRGWVLQLLLVLANAFIFRSEYRRAHDHILLFQNRDSPPPGGPGSRIYIPEEERGSVIAPDTGFHFLRLLQFSGLLWIYSTRLHTGYPSPLESLKNLHGSLYELAHVHRILCPLRGSM